MASGSDLVDVFDTLPDPILLLIFNRVADVKTLLRCRSVSKRFNSLVPQSDSLLLRVDRVIATSDDGFSFLSAIFKTLLQLIPLPPFTKSGNPNRVTNSPSRILRGFDAIKDLQIELPSGDLRLEKGTSVKWVARFGKTLTSCVIFAFRKNPSDPNPDSISENGNLKMRVVWTISALIAASARHYMIGDVIKEHESLSNLVVIDKENEGKMVMDKNGLIEFAQSNNGGDEMGEDWNCNRTKVPAVKMRMRHEAKLELGNGIVMEGATLVVVRPAVGNGERRRSEAEEQGGDMRLAMEAFGHEGVYGEAVAKLLKSRSYVLEMNSF